MSFCFRMMYCVNIVCVMVVVVSMVNLVQGQDTKENGDMDFENMGTVEGFLKTKEFKVSCGETEIESKDCFEFCY